MAKLGLFDAKVPRYTSYPTAPNFGAAVDSAQHTSWIEQIPSGSKISLYVHVPFCRRLCWFCAYRTQGTQSDAPIHAYLESLKAEIALLKTHLPKGLTLSRLHWGGGTPTILSPEMISDLASDLFDLAPMAADGEFLVEVDPIEFDQARCDALIRAGMSQASIGVQDFDPQIQQSIGRLQSYEVTGSAVEMLRAHGVKTVSAEILFGLPHQTQKQLATSLQLLLSLSPERVALLGYAHVPWMARRQSMIPSGSLPTPQDHLALFNSAAQILYAEGFASIGMDHFAHPDDPLAQARKAGCLRRGFQGYTDDPAPVLIGLGVSAISRFPQGYSQNHGSTTRYTSALEQGHFATLQGHVFGPGDALRGRLIEMLLCQFAISPQAIRQEFPESAALLDQLLAQTVARFPGVFEQDAEGLHLPQPCRPLARMIAQSFDAYTSS